MKWRWPWESNRTSPTQPRVKLPLVDISTQYGYNIAGAIRGPDSPYVDNVFKYAFTSRIRDLVGTSYGDIRTGDLSLDHITRMIEAMSDPVKRVGMPHYLTHVQAACDSLGALGLEEAALMLLIDDFNEDKLLKLLNQV